MITSVSNQRLAEINAARVRVVSVVEKSSPGKIVVHSFPDNSLGNGRAEELFGRIASEQVVDGPGTRLFDDEDIVGGVDDGYLEDGNGWELYLVHSESQQPCSPAAF